MVSLSRCSSDDDQLAAAAAAVVLLLLLLSLSPSSLPSLRQSVQFDSRNTTAAAAADAASALACRLLSSPPPLVAICEEEMATKISSKFFVNQHLTQLSNKLLSRQMTCLTMEPGFQSILYSVIMLLSEYLT